MAKELTEGLRCRACDKTLRQYSIDPELCEECLGAVTDYNRDITDKLSDEEISTDATSEVPSP